MKIMITYSTGQYATIDTDQKFTESSPTTSHNVAVRQDIRFDQLENFDDGREDGLWLDVMYAKMGEEGDAIQRWTPFFMVRLIADSEFPFINKVRSSSGDEAGPNGRLEMCRVETADGRGTRLLNLARTWAVLDVWGHGEIRGSVMDILLAGYMAVCSKRKRSPDDLVRSIPIAAEELDIDEGILSALVERALVVERRNRREGGSRGGLEAALAHAIDGASGSPAG